MSLEMLGSDPLAHLLIRPGMWVGLALSVLLLLGAVRLRRSRGAI
jgi:hypothetical protein